MNRFALIALMAFVVLIAACATPTAVPSTTPTPQPTNTSAPTATRRPSPTLTKTPSVSAVDQLLARCPTAQEVASINADLKLNFLADPTAGKLVCATASGSADLSLLQRRAYQTLLTMKHLQFTQPLPWTNKTLYVWYVSAIKGITFRSDIQFSACCSPKDIMLVRVANNLYLLQTDRWIEPTISGGAQDTIALLVHEARHNEGYTHDCPLNSGGTVTPNANDRTIAQLGAWGVEYYFFQWLANYADSSFLNDPSYRQTAQAGADNIRKTRFCNEPK